MMTIDYEGELEGDDCVDHERALEGDTVLVMRGTGG